jgi:hypothetical protein
MIENAVDLTHPAAADAVPPPAAAETLWYG